MCKQRQFVQPLQTPALTTDRGLLQTPKQAQQIKPQRAPLLRVRATCWWLPVYECLAWNSFMKATSFSIPSRGMAL